MVEMLLAAGAIKPGTDHPWTREEFTPKLIENLVGIKQRHWVSKEINTSDLALYAAEKAMEKAGIGWEDVGMLVVGSSTPESYYPSTACWVLNKIHKKRIAEGVWTENESKTKLRIPAFDVLAACASSLYAVDIIRKTLLFPETDYRYGIAIGAEVMSRTMSYKETNSDIFGDGGGAAVLERTDSPDAPGRILWTETGNDSWGAETTYSQGLDTRYHETPEAMNIFMAGHEIQKYVLKLIPEIIQMMVKKTNHGLGLHLKIEDIALFVCHQANARIFDFPAKKLGIPIEKFYVNCDRRANASSASIMMALTEADQEGRIKRGDLVFLLSFGGGLTWASALVKW